MNRREALRALLLGPSAAASAGRQTVDPPKQISVVETHFVIDPDEMKKWVAKEIVKSIQMNERGVRSSLRDALGITK